MEQSQQNQFNNKDIIKTDIKILDDLLEVETKKSLSKKMQYQHDFPMNLGGFKTEAFLNMLSYKYTDGGQLIDWFTTTHLNSAFKLIDLFVSVYSNGEIFDHHNILNRIDTFVKNNNLVLSNVMKKFDKNYDELGSDQQNNILKKIVADLFKEQELYGKYSSINYQKKNGQLQGRGPYKFVSLMLDKATILVNPENFFNFMQDNLNKHYGGATLEEVYNGRKSDNEINFDQSIKAFANKYNLTTDTVIGKYFLKNQVMQKFAESYDKSSSVLKNLVADLFKEQELYGKYSSINYQKKNGQLQGRGPYKFVSLMLEKAPESVNPEHFFKFIQNNLNEHYYRATLEEVYNGRKNDNEINFDQSIKAFADKYNLTTDTVINKYFK